MSSYISCKSIAPSFGEVSSSTFGIVNKDSREKTVEQFTERYF